MLGRCKLNYVEQGQGKTILFLHGWGGSANSFAPILPKLSSFRIIAIDFSGFGSSPECANMDIYEYAQSIYLFLKDKKIYELNIVAHSFGCRVAIILASMYDLKINKMVLTGGAGLKPKKSLCVRFRILKYKIIKGLVKHKIISKAVLENMGSSDYKKLSGDMKQTFVRVVNQHLDYLLGKITSSTLLVWGSKDKSTPMYMAKNFERRIEDCGLIVYNGCSHFAYLEKKTDFVNTLNYFLSVK